MLLLLQMWLQTSSLQTSFSGCLATDEGQRPNSLLNADDSGSMAFEEGGERIDDMKAVLGRTADAATLFDTDGIVVRYA